MWSRLTHRDTLLLSWKYPVHIPQTVPGGWVTLNIQWGNSRFMNHTQLLLKWMFNKANNYWKNRCGVSALPQLCLETSIHLNVANSNQLIVATCSKQGFRILVAANHLSSQWAVSTQTALVVKVKAESVVAALWWLITLCRHTLLVLLFGRCAHSNTWQVLNLQTEAEVVYGELSVLSLEL